MRYKAKEVNFGIICGQGAFGLAENLGIQPLPKPKKSSITTKQFPNIQKYMDDTIHFAQENGYVQNADGP